MMATPLWCSGRDKVVVLEPEIEKILRNRAWELTRRMQLNGARERHAGNDTSVQPAASGQRTANGVDDTTPGGSRVAYRSQV